MFAVIIPIFATPPDCRPGRSAPSLRHWLCVSETKNNGFYRAMLRIVRLRHIVSRLSVCLSVRNVQVCFLHKLEYFKYNFRALRFTIGLTPTWAILSNGNTAKIRVE